ncbi:MAG: hypothetical protein OXQ29_11025 [Rhodospirillaceae bacterium]|nr:hypothetical protein [Rhodospirillaceae bacterium]
MLRFVLSMIAGLMLLGSGPATAQHNELTENIGNALGLVKPTPNLEEMHQAPDITSLTFESRKSDASGATFEVQWSVANENLTRSGGCLEWRSTPSGDAAETPYQGSECFDETALSRRFTTWGGLASQYQVRVQVKYVIPDEDDYTSQWSNWSSVDVPG